MVNLYLKTLDDASMAATALQEMGATPSKFCGEEGQQIDGWRLCSLGRNDYTWSDGDWREEYTDAVIDRDGQLWIYLSHRSLQWELDGGSRKLRSYEKLTPATGEYLRQTDSAFRKIRGAIRNLV